MEDPGVGNPHLESAEAFAWHYYARHFLESPRPVWPATSMFANIEWSEQGLRPHWLRLCRAIFGRAFDSREGVPLPEPAASIRGIAQAAIITPSRVALYGYDPTRPKQGCHAVPRDGWDARPFHCFGGSSGKHDAPAAPSDLEAFLYDPPNEPWLAFQCGQKDLDPSSLALNLSVLETTVVSADGLRRVPLAGLRRFTRLACDHDVSAGTLLAAVKGAEQGRQAARAKLRVAGSNLTLLGDAFALATSYDLTAGELARFERWTKENSPC